VPFDPQITPTIETLRRLEPKLVFNLTEWLGGNRRLDSAIVGVLEMMNLRYTGSGPDAMQIARDKALAKSIVADLGITVARHTLVNGRRPGPGTLRFPLFVKPQFGDGSDEIGNAALVRSERELDRRLAAIRRRRTDTLMCEEFVAGRDLFVALLGNEPRVVPPLELVIGRSDKGAPLFATGRIKNDAGYRTKWRVRYRVPKVSPDVAERIDDASRRIFHALKLKDYARIDYRLTPENDLVFLEANPNPDLTPHTFGRDRCFAGVSYPELISTIVKSALARCARGRQ
jgi:D-alanine-D-alanine ligase